MAGIGWYKKHINSGVLYYIALIDFEWFYFAFEVENGKCSPVFWQSTPPVKNVRLAAAGFPNNPGISPSVTVAIEKMKTEIRGETGKKFGARKMVTQEVRRQAAPEALAKNSQRHLRLVAPPLSDDEIHC